MDMLGQFLAFHGTLKISIIGLGQEDETEKITLRHEIWWHDEDHCMKWSHSADVRIFLFGPAKGAVLLWKSCFF